MSLVGFGCAECGEVAAVVRAVPAGELVGFQGVLAGDRQRLDGVYVDFGGEHWKAIEDPDRFRALKEILESVPVDLLSLADAIPEAARFLCRVCEAPFCYEHWNPMEVIDPDMGSLDWVEGTCPRGHRGLALRLIGQFGRPIRA